MHILTSQRKTRETQIDAGQSLSSVCVQRVFQVHRVLPSKEMSDVK